MQILLPILLFIIGVLGGVGGYYLLLKKSGNTARDLLDNAQKEADRINKDRLYKFKVELQNKRSQFQNELRQKEEKVTRLESQLMKKEKDRSESNGSPLITRTTPKLLRDDPSGHSIENKVAADGG